MRATKPNRILLMMHSLILTTVLAKAPSTDTELMEAAFQGHCGHTSPCDQLCYEIHDGMYECDCIEGYELNKNGYSCQAVVYSTVSGDGRSKSDEDVLYQKGTSFSATLAKNSSYRDNQLTKDSSISNDYYISSEIVSFEGDMALASADQDDLVIHEIDSSGIHQPDELRLPKITLRATAQTVPKRTGQLKYDLKQRTNFYNDANNKQLNLKPPKHNTYHNQNTATHAIKSIFNENHRRNAVAPTTTELVMPYDIQISKNINISRGFDTTDKLCSLDCGLDGVCDNTEIFSRCLCPFGKTGTSCTEESKISVPKFSKKSWLAFAALRGAYKHVQIRVEFRPESFDGIVLLSGERDDLTGDFMTLLLNKGFVEFWFDCGSGVGSVRSSETILLNEWNSVIIYRHRWNAWLVLNHGIKVQGRSTGLFSRITFREPVFLGGTGNITGLANRLPVFDGFVGCIRRFVANEHEYKFASHPLGDVTEGFDIQDCGTEKCFKYPCQHGGKCLHEGGVCLCPIGFVGDLCEIRMDLQVPAFNGSSFLRYGPLGNSALIWLELKIILKPESPDGLILFSGREKHGDFIAVLLNDGFVEFFFDLGSGPAVVRSDVSLAVGQWHTIKISRTARLAVLKIDNTSEVMTISSNGFWHLSLPESLFLGGVNHLARLPVNLKSTSFFIGCIQKVDINGHSLAIVSEALSGANIGNCPHACVARPCGPLAECLPDMESYECRCGALNSKCINSAEVNQSEITMFKNISADKTDIENDSKKLKQSLKVFRRQFIHNLSPPISTTLPPRKHLINGIAENTTISKNVRDKINNENNQNIKVQTDDIPLWLNLDESPSNSSTDNFNQSVPLRLGNTHYAHRIHLHSYLLGKKLFQPLYGQNAIEEQKMISRQLKPHTVKSSSHIDIPKNYLKGNLIGNGNKYYRKNLAKKINTSIVKKDKGMIGRSMKSKSRSPTNNSTSHKSLITVLNDIKNEYDKEFFRNKSGESLTENVEILQEVHETNSDWSLLTKFELSSDHQAQIAEVHKNFGACFAGRDSYFHYSDGETISQIISYNIDVNLRIKTHSPNGVLLWTGRRSPTNGNDDFLSVGIENGYLHFRFDLGSGEVDIRFNKTKVSDGLWHRVRAIRDSQSGYLEVDGRKSKIQRSPGKLRQLNTDTGLYVGGMPDVSFVRRKYSNGIVGCISEVVLAGELKLNFDPNTLGFAHNVETGIL